MKAASILPLLETTLEGKFILFYGSNEELTHFRVEALLQHFKVTQSKTVHRLSLSDLESSPLTQSLFESASTPKCVLLHKASEKEIIFYLESPSFDISQNTIVFNAPLLRRGSPLLSFAESSKRCYAIPCYDGSDSELSGIISRIIQHHSVTLSASGLQRLIAHFKQRPSTIFLEMEKLLLIAPHDKVLHDEAIINHLASFQNPEGDLVLEWLTFKDVLRLTQFCHDEFLETQNIISCARTLQYHLMVLLEIRGHLNQGLNFAQSVALITPKPFFQSLKIYEKIASFWDSHSLLNALNKFLELELKAKSNLSLPDPRLSQLLLDASLKNKGRPLNEKTF